MDYCVTTRTRRERQRERERERKKDRQTDRETERERERERESERETAPHCALSDFGRRGGAAHGPGTRSHAE